MTSLALKLSPAFDRFQNTNWDKAAEKLADDIAVARLVPGRRLTVALLARWLRTTTETVDSIVPAFLEKNLLSKDGADLIVAVIDRTNLLPRLNERLPLEQLIARSAADKASEAQIKVMHDHVSLMKRCAMIGDIDGYMRVDREFELVIGAAAGLPIQMDMLCAMKREFRRAWFAYNRLRDLSEPASLRHALVESIAAHDADNAAKAVNEFINYLRRSF